MSDDTLLKMLIESREFQSAIKTVVLTALDEHKPKKENPIFYSEIEACKILHISRPTMYKYRKIGVIEAHKVGSRLLFTAESIQEALVKLPAEKHARR